MHSGHPWVYRSDVAAADAEAGAVVPVTGPRGRPLGHALFSDRSEITLRMIDAGRGAVDDDLLRRRLEQAIAFRQALDIDATAYRLVHGEADLLPSLIVDRYGDHLVVQALSQGMDRLAAARSRRCWWSCCRRPGSSRATIRACACSKGSSRRSQLLHGEVPPSIAVREGAVEYDVDPYHGQKTGLFLDQRENREAAARYAHGRLLDAFSYNGGFALALAPRCEEVLAVDISEDAVARIRRMPRATVSPTSRRAP